MPFQYSLSSFVRILSPRRVWLSLASVTPPRAKDVLEGIGEIGSRKTIFEHLAALVRGSAGPALPAESPLLVFTVRNVLSNVRCGAWIRGQTEQFLTVLEEQGRSVRPYHVLGLRHGRLTVETVVPNAESLADFEWLISGVPVLWDGENVFDRMITEAADHSHVFAIPRGHHPAANPDTHAVWTKLHDRFMATLGDPVAEAAVELKKAASGLRREDSYFHHVIGVDGYGNLISHAAVGKLEDLGEHVRKAGAVRALMVDNGGSTTVQFLPDGVRGTTNTLIGAPHHRARGTACLVAELEDTNFETRNEAFGAFEGSGGN